MNKIALIFDLDGTLWDSSQPVAEIWTEEGRKTLGEDFSLTKEDVRALMGKTMKDILLSIAPNLEEGEREALGARLFSSENEYLKDHPGSLFPKELETLLKLKADGHPLFIVSNCQLGYIENFIPIVPEGLFKDHMCWGDTHQEKCVTIRAIMERHGIEKAIYIGDTHGDEVASRKAGVGFLHAGYGFGMAEAPDAELECFEDILQNVR